jgi:hypothetical protein
MNIKLNITKELIKTVTVFDGNVYGNFTREVILSLNVIFIFNENKKHTY